MKVQCKSGESNIEIEIPDFTPPEKKTLVELKLKESSLHAVKYLMNVLKVSHIASQYIVTHINTNYGHCFCCTFDQLNEENITCSKCGVFNLNWKIDCL